jgi:N4-gp56 family major capsid protein
MALVKNSQLTVQQIAHIQKDVLVSLNKDTFWDKFCSHTSVPAGQTSVEWRKLNVPDLTQSDIADLTEGVTPASLSMTYVKFTVSPVDYGKWIEYTDKSKRYNFDDVVRDAKLILSNDAHQQAEWRKAAQFVSGTCTMDLVANTSGKTDGFLKSLLKARTILKRNKIKPISGQKYGCILTSEQAASVLVDYAAQITHTSQKEALIDGYLGELGGFILFETTHEKMYFTEGTGESAKTYGHCLFIGKSDFGTPVQTVSFGNSSVEVYDNGLGSVPSYDSTNGLRPDALHQRGSVGYKVMGFAARILADEAIIRAKYEISGGKSTLSLEDKSGSGGRSHYSTKSTSGATA